MEFIVNKIVLCVLGWVSFVSLNADRYPRMSEETFYDRTDEIPEVTIPELSSLQKLPDVAQYKFGDWSGVVGISRGILRSEAMWIAAQNPEITFFFYTKGGQMLLETSEGNYRRFYHGDAVFFKGEPQWGEAEGLADGYVKKSFN
jgi:hypothetical protein